MSFRINRIRLILAAALFASAVFAPLWCTLLIAIALCTRWRAWEVIAAGIFMDLYWLPTSISFHSLPLATIAAIIVVFALEPLRRQLLLGPQIL